MCCKQALLFLLATSPVSSSYLNFLRGSTEEHGRELADSCPGTHCASDVAADFGPFPGCDSSGLGLVELDTYRHGGVGNPLISLFGPANPDDAAAVVLTSAHGGNEKPSYLPDRDKYHPEFCNGSCRTYKDSYTKEITVEIAEQMIKNYCKVPYVVINQLHRSKLDANREIKEAAHENPDTEAAWGAFHDFISDAQTRIKDKFGTAMAENDLEGIQGVLLDVHGYSGKDWHSDGGPYIMWGYRLSADTTLDMDQYCPVDDRSYGTIGSLSFGRNLPGESLECLVRGPKSMGSRVNSKLPLEHSDTQLCGKGLPSTEFPSPKELASDSLHCADYASDGDTCHYYSGGYDIEMHEHLDWRNKEGVMMNALQAEFPRCIRFANGSFSRGLVHPEISEAVAISLCSFVHDMFPTAQTCG